MLTRMISGLRIGIITGMISGLRIGIITGKTGLTTWSN